MSSKSNTQTLATVKELKASLVQQQEKLAANNDVDVERCRDILHRLNELEEMDVDILRSTLIGTVVSQFKKHPLLKNDAKVLVKKWKAVAKSTTVSSTATSTVITTASSSAPTSSASAPVVVKKEQQGSMMERRESLDDASTVVEWSSLPDHRQTICQKLQAVLLVAKPLLIKDDGINATAVEPLVNIRTVEVEAAMWEQFCLDKKAYVDKARSLAFNLKKNVKLSRSLLLGSLPANDLIQMSSEQLANDKTRQARLEQAKKVSDSKRLDWDRANEDKINQMCGIEGELLKASLFTCGRCKSTKTTSTQKQTRSADEPMTVFVLCLNCGKRWRC